jgi:hypothetical protein
MRFHTIAITPIPAKAPLNLRLLLIGAVVMTLVAGSVSQTVGNQVRTMTTAVGYASSWHAGLHFGLGTATEIDRLEVDWPSGTRQRIDHVKTNQVLEIKER